MDKIKEQINDRMEILRTCLKDGPGKDDYGYIDPYDVAMNSELQFLERLLETVEKQ